MHAEKRGNGRFRVHFTIFGQRFKHTVKATNERDALREGREFEALAIEKWKAHQTTTRNVDESLGDILNIKIAFPRFCEQSQMKRCERQNFEIRRYLEEIRERLASRGISRLDQINDDVMRDLVAWKAAQFRWGRSELGRVSPAQINRSTVAVMRRVFRHAKKIWKLDLLNAPASWGEHTLKESRRRLRTLHDSEDLALSREMPEGYEDLRQFSLESMLRQTESMLKWSDVDLNRRIAIVRIKGGDTVNHPLTSRACEIIEKQRGNHPVWVFTYVAHRTRRKAHRKDGSLLWPATIKGQRYPITGNGLRSIFGNAKERAGVMGYKWHDNRRTGAAELAREYGIQYAKEVLHHTDVATTYRYIGDVEKDLPAVMENAGAQRRARIEALRDQACKGPAAVEPKTTGSYVKETPDAVENHRG